MDDLTKQIVYGVAAPLVAAPIVGLLGAPRRGPTDDGKPRRDPLALRLPLLLGAGAAGAMLGSFGIKSDAWFALCWIAVAAAVVGVVASLLPRRRWASALIALATGGATLAVGWGIFQPADPWELRVVMGAGPAALYLVLETAARRVTGPTVPFVLSGACGMSAATIAFANSQNIALPAGAVAVALLALAALAIWRRGLVLADGAVCVVSALLVCVPLTAHLYLLDDTFPHFAFTVAPASALLLGLLVIPAARTRAAALVLAVSAAAVAIGGFVWASQGAASSDDDSSEASMYEMYE